MGTRESRAAICLRFIPTYMGNAKRVFPKREDDYGSSPRTWGTLFAQIFTYRFIPTYMGNAVFTSQSINLFFAVHPHVHGERLRNACIAIGYYRGSSPRTWERAAGRDREVSVHPHVHGERCGVSPIGWCRFNPLHGERVTQISASRTRFIPRTWGTLVFNNTNVFSGSSPRTWGTHFQPFCVFFRFIPTYMGNASFSVTISPNASVHPHVHGERALNVA